MTENRKIDSKEAEAKAKDFIKQRHARVERIFFSTLFPDKSVWVLQGEVEFKRAYFFVTVRTVEVRVNMNTAEVMLCQEGRLQNPKKQPEEKRP